jgi:hypothetical protein
MTDDITFTRNTQAHRKSHDMCKYIGFNIAWSEDGTNVLGQALRLPDLLAEMEKRGIQDFVIEFMPDFSPAPATPAGASTM